MSPPCFDLSRLRECLNPWRLHWYPQLHSTNDEAHALRAEGRLFCPAVVLTGEQTAGRGRGSNVWHAGAQTLTVSFALVADERRPPQHLPLIVGVLLRRVAARFSDGGVRIKWPNDLLHDGQKLAGILCERQHGIDVIGIGINVGLDAALPPDLRRHVTSLRDISGRAVDKTDVLLALAEELAVLPRRPVSWADVREEYAAHDALGGETVQVGELRGYCEGVDGDGRLVVHGESGRTTVLSGTVRLAVPA